MEEEHIFQNLAISSSLTGSINTMVIQITFGIVQKVENGRVYTIEGNSTGDMCKQNNYLLSSSEIQGYGTPMYQ